MSLQTIPVRRHGRCPFCREWYVLTGSGRMRAHRQWRALTGDECAGTGQAPAEITVKPVERKQL